MPNYIYNTTAGYDTTATNYVLTNYTSNTTTTWANPLGTWTTYVSPVGTQHAFAQEETKEKNGRKVIHPRLYFQFVKSKLNKLEEAKLNERLLRLQKFVKSAAELKQQALYEEFSRKIAITVREQELYAVGIEYFVDRAVVNQFRDKVRELDIAFCKLEDYSRAIPDSVKKRIDKIKKLKLIDQYWVLYVDHKVEKEIKTNKQKIKEKDPILFGIQDYMPDKLYFIVDWIDEYCDLTLDKFITEVKKNDPDYEIATLDEIDEDLIQKIVRESRERHARLKNTKRDNFQDLMKEEDKANEKGTVRKIIDKIKNKTT